MKKVIGNQLYLKYTCKLNKMINFVKNKYVICGLFASIYLLGLYKTIEMESKQNYRPKTNPVNYFVPF